MPPARKFRYLMTNSIPKLNRSVIARITFFFDSVFFLKAFFSDASQTPFISLIFFFEAAVMRSIAIAAAYIVTVVASMNAAYL